MSNPSDKLYQPSLRDLIQLPVPFDVKLSPDSSQAAVLVRAANWKDNNYENLVQVYDVATGKHRQLTRSGSVNQMEWLDNDTLALLKNEPGNQADAKPQVWIYESLAGEGWRVSQHKTGVEWFKPFAGGIIFKAANPEKEEQKPRTSRFGKYLHYEQEDSASALYYLGLEETRRYQTQLKASTDEEAEKLVEPVIELSRLFETSLAIQEVVASPTGDAIYLNCWPRDDLVYLRQVSHYQITLDAPAALAAYLEREQARKAEKPDPSAQAKPETDNDSKSDEKEDLAYLGHLSRLSLPQSAWINAVSPDGSQLLVLYPERDDKMYTQPDLWILPVESAVGAKDNAACLSAMQKISAGWDREPMDKLWVESGIFVSYVDHSVIRIAQFGDGMNAPQGVFTTLDLGGVFPVFGFHVSSSGAIGFVGANATSFNEFYCARPAAPGQPWSLQRLSDFGEAVQDWELGTLETIRWHSRDGVEIEGVLRKPANFDPSKKYPLVFVVHGGPTWFSSEYLISGEDLRNYPSIQFNHQDMLVLKPNYRGSIGRGQAFTELNVNNLGIGDLWDLESAIDHLVAQGFVDPERIGCMGWSQGGYISAFAGLHSDRFKAVSVGAGISDWYTYHISNDIPDFTTDYLSNSPFRERELYVKTAPISNIQNAHTPMLIQHGSDDRRVPLSNAHELYRGLKAMGVPVELFIYPGMAHPITKPRENHAVMHQNLTWFSHYLLGLDLKLE